MWYMATADEAGEPLAGWLVENRPELFSTLAICSTKVVWPTVRPRRSGNGRSDAEGAFMVKTTSSGRPGHGSAPQVTTSVTQLVRALERIRETDFPVNIVPAVAAMFEGLLLISEGSAIVTRTLHKRRTTPILLGLRLRSRRTRTAEKYLLNYPAARQQ